MKIFEAVTKDISYLYQQFECDFLIQNPLMYFSTILSILPPFTHVMVHLKIFNKTPINYTYTVTYSGPVTLNILNGKLHFVYPFLFSFDIPLMILQKLFLWPAK